MGGNWWKYVVGTIILLVGIGYVVLEYIPSIEPPANMRCVDGNVHMARTNADTHVLGMRTGVGARSRSEDEYVPWTDRGPIVRTHISNSYEYS